MNAIHGVTANVIKARVIRQSKWHPAREPTVKANWPFGKVQVIYYAEYRC